MVYFFDQNQNIYRREYPRSYIEPKSAEPVAHDGSISAVSFTSDGLQLASLSVDMKMKVWDVSTLSDTLVNFPTGVHQGPRRHNRISISPDSSVVAFGVGPGMGLYDFHTGKQYRMFKENYVCVNALQFHPTLEELYSGDANGQVCAHVPRPDSGMPSSGEIAPEKVRTRLLIQRSPGQQTLTCFVRMS